MKKTTIAQAIIALLTITCLNACNNGDKKMAAPAPTEQLSTAPSPKPPGELTEAVLIGKWKSSEYFDETAVAKMMGDSNEDKGTMTFIGTETYYAGGTSKSEGQMTLTLPATAERNQFSLKFDFNITNTWKLNGNTLQETTVDAKVEPADEVTRELITKDPSLIESIRPLKGETEIYKIVNHTTTLIEVESEDKVRMTMHKE